MGPLYPQPGRMDREAGEREIQCIQNSSTATRLFGAGQFRDRGNHRVHPSLMAGCYITVYAGHRSNTMRLLVTGVAGFIGSNFVYYWLSHHAADEIIGLDNLTYAGNLENLENIQVDQKKRFTFMKGDICDSELVKGIFDRQDVDYVVNFAAESHVDRSIHDPQIFIRSNILGMANLLDAARKAWKDGSGAWLPKKRFLQISTDEVYG